MALIVTAPTTNTTAPTTTTTAVETGSGTAMVNPHFVAGAAHLALERIQLPPISASRSAERERRSTQHGAERAAPTRGAGPAHRIRQRAGGSYGSHPSYQRGSAFLHIRTVHDRPPAG